MPETLTGRWDFIKGNIGVMLLSSGLWNLANSMTRPFYALYVLALGGRHIDIGLIFALGAVVRIAPTLFGGFLADALGRKKILYTMSFLLALNELVFAFAPDYRFLFLGTVLASLLGGLRDPAMLSILADSTTPGNRAQSLAMWQVVSALFGLFSPYAIGLFIDAAGILPAMRLAYVFTFVMATVASLLRYRYIEETLDDVREIERDVGVAAREIFRGFVETLRDLPVALWVFLLIDFVFTFAFAVAEPFYVTYAKEVVGLTASQWGVATMLAMAVTILLKPPLAWASDTYGRVKFILPGMFLWSGAYLLFARSGGFQAVLLARLMLALGSSIGDPAWEAIFYDYSPREHRGRFSALTSVSWSLIWGAGSIVGGAIYEGVSKALIFDLGAGLMVIGGIAFLLKVREPERREE